MQAEHETYWVCLNRGCGKTVAYEEAERDLETRACECGSIMKKRYARDGVYLPEFPARDTMQRI